VSEKEKPSGARFDDFGQAEQTIIILRERAG